MKVRRIRVPEREWEWEYPIPSRLKISVQQEEPFRYEFIFFCGNAAVQWSCFVVVVVVVSDMRYCE